MTNAEILDFLVERLHAKPTGNGFFMAQCPAHDDRRASLSMGLPHGKLWIECFAKCSDDAVRAAIFGRLGLQLFADDGSASPSYRVPVLPLKAYRVRPHNIQPVRQEKTPAERTADALKIWDATSLLDRLDEDNPAFVYMQRRGIASAIGSPVLRYHNHCQSPINSKHPALVSRVEDQLGRFLAVHVVYLRRDGSKASIEPTKASWGPVRGGAVRIGGMAREIVIGEGVETSIAAGIQLNLPAWAALSSGNLERVVLPDAIRSVVIAADHDAAGIKAAEAAYRRWKGQGRVVHIVKPNAHNADFADVLTGRRTSEIV